MIQDTDPVPSELRYGDIVIEIGAYEGAWVAKLCGQVQCTVYAYEPAARAYKMALDKLKGRQNVALFPVALGVQNGRATLYDCMRDGANTFVPAKGQENEVVSVIDAHQEMASIWAGASGDIALMHLNAEGGELDVLERLMDTGLIKRVKMIMVQWHPYDAETSRRIERVIERLGETHWLENRHTWGFWQRKEETT